MSDLLLTTPLSDAELFWVVRWEAEGSMSEEDAARLEATETADPGRVARFRALRDYHKRGPYMVHDTPQAPTHYGVTFGDGPTSVLGTCGRRSDAQEIVAALNNAWEDTARLNWLEKLAAKGRLEFAHNRHDGVRTSFRPHLTIYLMRHGSRGGSDDTLREAIDKARKRLEAE